MKKSEKEKMYIQWLKSLTDEKWVTLWDKPYSTRIMIIDRYYESDGELSDTYFEVSYYDDTTGDYWSPQREYIWDVVERALMFNNVDLTKDVRKSPNCL